VGSDVASVRTTAVRDGDELIVNGSKRFCSGARICDYIYTVVRTDPEAPRYQNLSIVLIPPTAAGITIEPIDSLGMKGAATTDVTFENVRVSIENVLGGPSGLNQGWRMITGSGLDVEKLEVAAISLGIATAAFEDAWTYSQQRMQFGKAISAYQAIRHKLADMQTQLHAARLMMYHAAWLANSGRRCGVETSMTKLFVTEVAKAIALECQTIFGAYGYVKEVDTERYVRDALLMPIIGGSSSIQRNNIVNWSGLGLLAARRLATCGATRSEVAESQVEDLGSALEPLRAPQELRQLSRLFFPTAPVGADGDGVGWRFATEAGAATRA